MWGNTLNDSYVKSIFLQKNYSYICVRCRYSMKMKNKIRLLSELQSMRKHTQTHTHIYIYILLFVCRILSQTRSVVVTHIRVVPKTESFHTQTHNTHNNTNNNCNNNKPTPRYVIPGMSVLWGPSIHVDPVFGWLESVCRWKLWHEHLFLILLFSEKNSKILSFSKGVRH